MDPEPKRKPKHGSLRHLRSGQTALSSVGFSNSRRTTVRQYLLVYLCQPWESFPKNVMLCEVRKGGVRLSMMATKVTFETDGSINSIM